MRGNAAHVAEKYMQLARDANSSGDSVAAENYLQHAEHYFRVISAAQAQMYTQPGVRSEAVDNRDAGDGAGAEAAPIAGKPAPESVEESAEPLEREARAPRQRRQRRSRLVEKPSAAGEAGEAAAAPAVPAVPAVPAAPAVPGDGADISPGASATDPAGAPQPEVGELPTFVTDQSKTKAG